MSSSSSSYDSNISRRTRRSNRRHFTTLPFPVQGPRSPSPFPSFSARQQVLLQTAVARARNSFQDLEDLLQTFGIYPLPFSPILDSSERDEAYRRFRNRRFHNAPPRRRQRVESSIQVEDSSENDDVPSFHSDLASSGHTLFVFDETAAPGPNPLPGTFDDQGEALTQAEQQVALEIQGLLRERQLAFGVGPSSHSIGIYPWSLRTPDRSPSPSVEEEQIAALQRVQDWQEAHEVQQALVLSPTALRPLNETESQPSSQLRPSLEDRLSSPTPTDDIAHLYSDQTPPELTTPRVSQPLLKFDTDWQDKPFLADRLSSPSPSSSKDVESYQEQVLWDPENPFAPLDDENLRHLHAQVLIYHDALQHPTPFTSRNSYTPDEAIQIHIDWINRRLRVIGLEYITVWYDFDRYRPIPSQ